MSGSVHINVVAPGADASAAELKAVGRMVKHLLGVTLADAADLTVNGGPLVYTLTLLSAAERAEAQVDYGFPLFATLTDNTSMPLTEVLGLSPEGAVYSSEVGFLLAP